VVPPARSARTARLTSPAAAAEAMRTDAPQCQTPPTPSVKIVPPAELVTSVGVGVFAPALGKAAGVPGPER
jgi:hypothetical protein